MFDAFRYSPFAITMYCVMHKYCNIKIKVLPQDEKNYHVCDTPEDYLFWDEIHPSTRAHDYLAFEFVMR